MECAKAGYGVQGILWLELLIASRFLHFPTALLPYGDETHFQSLNHHTCFETVCDLGVGLGSKIRTQDNSKVPKFPLWSAEMESTQSESYFPIEGTHSYQQVKFHTSPFNI